MSATESPSSPSLGDAQMARVLVMLPVATIRQLDAMRAETRVSRSTQLRILVLRALRGERSSSP